MSESQKIKTVAILQSNYIPWKGYFDIINSVDEFVIYDDVQFTKNDWRNRNRVITPQGKSWISIPVKHRQGQLIYEVEVSDPLWQLKHWDRLKQCYGSAPFFREFKQPFEDFYQGEPILNLSEANLKLINIINDILDIRTNISDSKKFSKEFGPSERLLNIVKELDGNKYLSGPSAKSYLDESLFVNEGIEISYMDYSKYPTYPQLSETFAHDVSVLDVIFNCGPESRDKVISVK